MSTYFSKVIKAGRQLREFNFKLASLNDDTRYVVDVPDDKGDRIVFTAQKSGDGIWTIADPSVPSWLHEVGAALSEAIEENLKMERARKAL